MACAREMEGRKEGDGHADFGMTGEDVARPIQAVLCYVHRMGKTLMLHRNKNPKDIHKDKWNGLGGKMKSGETPEEAARREVFEESGLEVQRLDLRGCILFPDFAGGESWMIYIFFVPEFRGEAMTTCPEGDLHWIETEKIGALPLWEGDHIFLKWMKEPCFFSGKMVYRDGHLVDHQVEKYLRGH